MLMRMIRRKFFDACSLAVAALLIGLDPIAILGADSSPTVSVSGGQVRGAMLDKGGAVFKGIPYTQPPIGDLRWREPMPVKPWSGVRAATAFGAVCTQAPYRNLKLSSEDCLFLNVWTPEWPSRSERAVLLWIPIGGNFRGGSSLSPYDDLETLARRGIVVVTVNIRVGPFGFFSHPELTRESPHYASGNQGILDLIAALKWVRENIARFGGDPDKVTIGGDSGGGWM